MYMPDFISQGQGVVWSGTTPKSSHHPDNDSLYIYCSYNSVCKSYVKEPRSWQQWTFLAHLIHHQVYYCYRKLAIWKVSGADQSVHVRGPPMWCVLANERGVHSRQGSPPVSRPVPSREWTPGPLISKSCDLSKPTRGSPHMSGPVCSREGTPHVIVWMTSRMLGGGSLTGGDPSCDS